MQTRGSGKSSTQKHFEFAKSLFKIWDADGGGFLDVDEISLPLISLGLSTDTGFVEKLIKALKQKKKKTKKGGSDKTPQSIASESQSQEADENDLSFTLKDFVTIFESDKVGEKITKKVQDVCRQRLEDRVNEELALNLKLQQMKAAHMCPQKDKEGVLNIGPMSTSTPSLHENTAEINGIRVFKQNSNQTFTI